MEERLKNKFNLQLNKQLKNRSEKGCRGEALLKSLFQKYSFEILFHDVSVGSFKNRIDFILQKNNKIYLVEVKSHRWSGSGFEQIISQKQREAYLKVGLYLKKQRSNTEIYYWLVGVFEEKAQTLECLKI